MHLGYLLYICNSVAFNAGCNMNKYNERADKLGIASAVICTIHCLVVPVLFVVKYSLTNQVVGHSFMPWWWEAIDYVFLVISFIAVYHAASHTYTRKIKRSLWFFWTCLALAIFFEQSLFWLAYIASAGLVTTHYFNIRMHKKKAVS